MKTRTCRVATQPRAQLLVATQRSAACSPPNACGDDARRRNEVHVEVQEAARVGSMQQGSLLNALASLLCASARRAESERDERTFVSIPTKLRRWPQGCCMQSCVHHIGCRSCRQSPNHVWLIANKSAGGMYVSTHVSDKTKGRQLTLTALPCDC